MTLNECTGWLRKLERRFNRREMSEESITDWYEALRHIPSEAWEKICTHWWWREKHFPSPEELDSGWRQWLDEHPERQTRESYWCPECGGYGAYIVTGLATVTIMGNPRPPDAETWVACRCRPTLMFEYPKGSGRKIPGIQMSRHELVRIGCRILWPETLEPDEAEEQIKGPNPQRERGFRHIGQSLPLTDREDVEDVPF